MVTTCLSSPLKPLCHLCMMSCPPAPSLSSRLLNFYFYCHLADSHLFANVLPHTSYIHIVHHTLQHFRCYLHHKTFICIHIRNLFLSIKNEPMKCARLYDLLSVVLIFVFLVSFLTRHFSGQILHNVVAGLTGENRQHACCGPHRTNSA